jgi:hypothetical protein
LLSLRIFGSLKQSAKALFDAQWLRDPMTELIPQAAITLLLRAGQSINHSGRNLECLSQTHKLLNGMIVLLMEGIRRWTIRVLGGCQEGSGEGERSSGR